uniref:U-scoloptoxin(10)-Er1a n=1 Tax=Ethmostigmus rubripes TaxID=62613 RepID=TXA1A_ETHRU|nr:RecName: Full=U-scoloptoxin(10)-Er1a; Short=U-SLPTX(10)-Er1a; Flags: Precursor [Ethmostigmus rubripes]
MSRFCLLFVAFGFVLYFLHMEVTGKRTREDILKEAEQKGPEIKAMILENVQKCKTNCALHLKYEKCNELVPECCPKETPKCKSV